VSALIISILEGVERRLANPRQWNQGMWAARRKPNGVLVACGYDEASCWCLSGAITAELLGRGLAGNGVSFTELRGETEDALLDSLRAQSVHVNAAYLWNDAYETSYADVMALLKTTRERLQVAA
jgi:hypothetical protein